MEMLLIKTAQVRLPQQVKVGLNAGWGAVEQPDVLEWFAAAGQVLDADADDGAGHDGQFGVFGPVGPVPTAAQFLVHVAPGLYLYLAVAGGVGGQFVVGCWSALGVGQGQFAPVPGGCSPLARWAGPGVGVEDPFAVEPGPDRYRFTGEFVGQRSGVVARCQHHQRLWGVVGLLAGGGQVANSALLTCVVEWSFAGGACAGHGGEQRLQLAEYGVQGHAGAGAFGFRRSRVQKAWART